MLFSCIKFTLNASKSDNKTLTHLYPLGTIGSSILLIIMVARRLVDTTDSISEICWTCGFNNLSNFNRLFLKHKGCSPTEFREKYCKTKNIV